MSNIKNIISCIIILIIIIYSQSQAIAAIHNHVKIRFDDTAVRQLITMIENKDTSNASIEKWLELPANRYLVTIGTKEENLTRDQLKANLIAVINGTANKTNQPASDMGCLRVTSIKNYKTMLDQLEDTEETRASVIANRILEFMPEDISIDETIYIHLGGDWDAVNDHGSIYVNMRFWHDIHKPGWDGLNMIIAHETTHTVQNATYGNPELQNNGVGSLFTVLSKTQREGTARYVEYDTDPGQYEPDTYGFYYRAITTECYRSFNNDIKTLKPLYDTCFPLFDHDRFANEYADKMSNGGVLYNVGYGMAKAIDERLGRPALIKTIEKGPKYFFTTYDDLCITDKNLPLLPKDIIQFVNTMPDKIQ